MLLAVDIGNTNIVLGVFDDSDKLKNFFRIETDRERTVEEFRKLIQSTGIGSSSVDSIIVSSVVPQTNKNFRTFCEEYFHQTPFFVNDHIAELGMPVLLDKPSEVGADRVVNAIAFYNKYKSAGIIIDFGTATTFDVVSDKGEYVGGMISPGINLALHALEKAAAQLPEIKLAKPERAIGKDTISAMQSGLYHGYIGLIENSVEQIRKELGADVKVIATGGLARFFSEAKYIDSIEENLTLEGLLLIFKAKNNQ